MELKPNSDKHTPGKLMQNILEKAVQGKFTYSFACDSPYRLLPPASTPPSRIVKIKNPFESQLTDRLHQSVFSPSVFNNMQSSKTEEKFRWAIEDISSLKPADIDETTIEQFELTVHDPEVERTAQANIEKFFSEKHIVPSPFDNAVKSVKLISESTSPIKTEELKQFTNGVTQTILTLPPKLPEHIEAILKPYFSYTVDQQQDQNRNSSLYRRLFEFDDEQHSPSSVLTSPAPSCNLSATEFLSPLNENKTPSHRHFGSPHDVNNHMPECNLSPIDLNLAATQVAARSASVTRLNFSDHMSLDISLNLVPDTLDQMPSNQSLAFESMRSPNQEVLSNSSVNWDMEYKHVSLGSPKSQNSSENEMDVSNSHTPKSKIFTSQRKKLSDSFLKIEESNVDEENKENMYDSNKCVERTAKSNLFIRDDTTDVGYHTGYGLTMSEESWSSTHLFASTPTKNKN